VTLLAASLLAVGSLLPLAPYARAAALLVPFALALPALGMAGPADVRRLRALLHEPESAPPATPAQA
jgi:hypothetical protein